ncbi:metallophosphoesterase, partial [Ralstonia pseudosolanacearum]|uniref:metallophosphoesterase n=1 Tax=Ralstonia pseudosolanacearum TaxID=1310165 RepID=UPI003CEF77AD
MSVYAIGDLHLSFNEEKPMDIFGQKWKKHEIQIEYNWLRTIKNDDLVILPGDFSWAINIQDALKDFQFLNRLPGKKVFIKGNHDYWWTTLKSMYEFLDENE